MISLTLCMLGNFSCRCCRLWTFVSKFNVSTILSVCNGLDPGSGSEYGHVAYQIKVNGTCSNIVANILPVDTPSTPGVGSKDQNILSYESSHGAYQIKWNGA